MEMSQSMKRRFAVQRPTSEAAEAASLRAANEMARVCAEYLVDHAKYRNAKELRFEVGGFTVTVGARGGS